MKLFLFTCVAASLSFFTRADELQAPKLVKITDGHDLSLPESVQPLPSGAMADYNLQVFTSWKQEYPLPDDAVADDVYFIRRSGFNWNDMNPSPGVYHWDEFDQTIRSYTQYPNVGYGLSSPMHSYFGWNGIQQMPDFVTNVTYLEQTTLCAIWEEGTEFFDRYLEFLTAFRQHIDNTPDLQNRMRWLNVSSMDYMFGEGNFRPVDDAVEHYQQAVATGFTPETYEASLKHLIDIYSEAFEGLEHLLCWNNWTAADGYLGADVTGDQALTDAFWAAKGAVYEYALEKGWGGRDGQIEAWTRYISEGYGNQVNEDGYLIYDNDFPISKENRISFSENENYDDGTVFGGNIEYRFQASTFRLLQLRRNVHRMYMWMGLNDAPTAPVARYSQLSLGRRPNDSIDAWCWLRECYPKFSMNGASAMKNFERWVLQRDVADGMTLPAEYVDGFHVWSSSVQYEYQARQTDYKTGNDSIYFDVEDVWFGSEPCDLMAHITYFDRNNSSFNVEYSNQNGITNSPVVRTGNSGMERTAILELPGFVPNAAFAGSNGMDFRLLRVQGGDAVIKMVRLVKSTKGSGTVASDDFSNGTFAGGEGWASPWRRVDILIRDRDHPVNPSIVDNPDNTYSVRISRGGMISRAVDPVLKNAELQFTYSINSTNSPAHVMARIHDGTGWHLVWEDTFTSQMQSATATIDLTSYDQVEQVKFELDSDRFDNILNIENVALTGTGPVVLAGTDQAIQLPADQVALDGTVAGLSNTLWSKVSGAAPVTFADASSVDTTATFSEAGTYVLRLTGSESGVSVSDDVEVLVQEVQTGGDVVAAINCGGSAYTAADGTAYSADANYSGGSTFSTTEDIKGTEDDTLYRSQRYGNVTYSIPVVNGDYLVTLKMADINTVAANDEFDVSIEGTLVLDDLNLNGVVEYDKAYDRPFSTTVSDGVLTIELTGISGDARINAILVMNSEVFNAAPEVNAGPDQIIQLPTDMVSLDGTAADDGLTGSTVSTTWSKVSGPGTVGFADAAAIDTTATFSDTGTYVLRLTANDGEFSASDDVQITLQEEPAPGAVAAAINCGGDNTYTATDGTVYSADTYFSGGSPYSTGSGIGGTEDDALYQTERYGDLTYSIPVANGIYEVTLKFAETYQDEAGARVFDAFIEDVLVLDDVDILAAAGAKNTAYDRTFFTAVRDSTLTIYIKGTPGPGKINAILVATPENTNNIAPEVNAGINQTIQLPTDQVDLDGTVTDDYLPNATVNTTWSKVSGPGTVTFADDASVDTTATFSAAGTYVLRLTASDTELSASDDVQITVEAAPNTAPVVNAGINQTIQLPTDQIALDGTVTDDGLPEGATVSTIWSKVSGPGTVDFADDASVDTTATFSEAGTYVLRLTASDTELSASDDVQITLQEETAPGAVVAAINCGGGTYTATDGTAYSADIYYSGDRTYSTSDPIDGTEDDILYQTERYDSGGDLTYSIPVANGDYEVTLKMAEIYKTGVGQRLLDVSIEGTQVIDDLDLIAVAGHDAAYDRTFSTTVSDGVLTIQITAVVDTAQMNAIRVVNTDTQSPYDEWADQFGGTNTIGSATDDYDQDGISNFEEYALNGNPTHANASGLVEFNVSGTTVSFVYSSNSVDDSLTYRLMDRTNLVAGAVRTNGWDSQSVGPVNGDYVTVSNRYGTATDARFIWLEVETP